MRSRYRFCFDVVMRSGLYVSVVFGRFWSAVMAELVSLEALVRSSSGGAASRRDRRSGLVPAILYGGGEPPTAISLRGEEISSHASKGGFFSTLFSLSLGESRVRAIPRDVQRDPVRDDVMHVDFMRLGAGARISVEVPVTFENSESSPGLKRGGTLNVVRYSIELECDAESIPSEIVVDLSGLEIGDSVHISSISLPLGTSPTISDRDFTIATVAAPSALR